MKVHTNNTKHSLLISEMVKIISTKIPTINYANISIHFSPSKNSLWDHKFYKIEDISSNTIRITLSRIDFSKLSENLSYSELISVVINRFVESLSQLKETSENSSFDYKECTTIISQYFISDDEISSSAIQWIYSNDNHHYQQLHFKINKKLIEENNIGQRSNNSVRQMTSKAEYFTTFNEEIIDTINSTLYFNGTDFLLRFNKPNIFHMPQQAAVLSLGGPKTFLLGLVLSKIYHFKKKEKISDITFNEVIDDLTNDVFNETNKRINNNIKDIESTTSKVDKIKTRIDKIPVPLSYTSEKSFLNLDEQYSSHQKNDYGHTVNRDQVLQNYRNNKNKKKLTLHNINQKNISLFNNSKSISLSDGIIILGYWRLYYYHQPLFKDLSSLEREQDLSTIINIFFRYYMVIEYDFKDNICDYFRKAFKSTEEERELEIESIYKRITLIEANDTYNKARTLEKLKKQYHDLINIKDNSFEKLKSEIPELISLHFNQKIIERIISEYAYAVGNHELLLKNLIENDKDITELL